MRQLVVKIADCGLQSEADNKEIPPNDICKIIINAEGLWQVKLKNKI
jgi:hypothetical protein